MVDYVFQRPIGEKEQEAAGTMISLSALCNAHGINIHNATQDELQRITDKSMIEKIREKQKTKPNYTKTDGVTRLRMDCQ